MANFNEHALEMSIMELFKDEGYTYVSGDQIHRERTEVLLTDDLNSCKAAGNYTDGYQCYLTHSVLLSLGVLGATPNEVFGSVLSKYTAR